MEGYTKEERRDRLVDIMDILDKAGEVVTKQQGVYRMDSSILDTSVLRRKRNNEPKNSVPPLFVPFKLPPLSAGFDASYYY